MSLGQTLANTIEENRIRNIHEQAVKDAAERRKIEEKRASISLMLTKTRNTLIAHIESRTKPHTTIKEYDHQQWIRAAQKGKAQHQDLWTEFQDWAQSEDLTIAVLEEHDGVGIQSWIAITVAPQPTA